MVNTNLVGGTWATNGAPLVPGAGSIPFNGGNYWYVCNRTGANGSDGNEGTADMPFATLDFAIGKCVADQGDVIIILSGHAETISAAAGIACDVAGITIIGEGNGSDRPQFTFATSTAATMTVSAANIVIANIVGICGIDLLVSPWVVSAAGCTLGLPGAPIEWQDPSSSFQAIRQILTTSAADKLTINLRTIGITSGGTAPVNAVRLVGCNAGIINIDFYGRASTAVVEFLTTVCTDIEVYGYMYNSGVTNGSKDVVDTQGSSTWYMSINDGAAGYPISGGSAATPTGAPTGLAENVAVSSTAVLANGTTIFTVAGGPIAIMSLISECVAGGDASAAATVQYSATATGLSAQTISNASGSVANAAAHATVSLIGTALTTAAVYNSKGVNLGMSPPGGIVTPVGIITTVIGSGPTTSTWRHILRYKPLVTGVTVS